MKNQFVFSGKPLLIDCFRIVSDAVIRPDQYDILRREPVDTPPLEPREAPVYFTETNREHKNMFRNRYGENRCIRLEAGVFSERGQKSILCFSAPPDTKLWINGRLTAIHCLYYRTSYLAVELEPGENRICLEKFSPGRYDTFSLQILDAAFEMSGDIRSLAASGNPEQRENLFNVKLLSFVTDSGPDTRSDIIRFQYMPNDPERFCSRYEVRVFDCDPDPCGFFTAELMEPVSFDMRPYREGSRERFRHLTLGFTFFLREGGTYEESQSFLPFDCRAEEDAIIRETCEAVNGQSEFVKAQLFGRREFIESSSIGGYPLSRFWTVWQMRELIERMERGEYSEDEIYRPGVHEIYFRSVLDRKYEMLRVFVPQDYTKEKKYPILLNLATAQYSGVSFAVNALPEDCLVADITLRGVLCGSYISEAQFFELFRWLKANYSIDEDRVYLAGCSSGGFAVWSILQNHPGIAAAAFPLVGAPYLPSVENAALTPKIVFVSEKDFVLAPYAHELRNAHENVPGYREYFFESMLHFHFNPHCYNKRVTEQLLTFVRERFPKKFRFRTERNRHRKAYWLELHGIAEGQAYASVEAEYSPENIRLQITNCEGVTITLPPEIRRGRFTVFVNKDELAFSGYAKDELILRCENGSWREAKTALPCDLRRGTGLLDVYFGPLTIAVPVNAGEETLRCAARFAAPHSSGFDTRIYTKYPIVPEGELTPEQKSGNLIVFDVGGSSGMARRLGASDGKSMRIWPNPLDPKQSILTISVDDEKQLAQNLLTRRVVLPTYYNGPDPRWNSKEVCLK